jgi:hypothetical protein
MLNAPLTVLPFQMIRFASLFFPFAANFVYAMSESPYNNRDVLVFLLFFFISNAGR